MALHWCVTPPTCPLSKELRSISCQASREVRYRQIHLHKRRREEKSFSGLLELMEATQADRARTTGTGDWLSPIKVSSLQRQCGIVGSRRTFVRC